MLRALSLDIVAEALAVSYYFTCLFSVKLSAWYWPALAVSVWSIYLTDHIADYYSGSKADLTFREAIFLKNQKSILWLLGVLLGVLVFLISKLPFNYLYFGIPGGLFIGLYLLINQFQTRQQRYFLPREIVIATFYLYGTCGLPLSFSANLSPAQILVTVSFFFLVLSNVFIYSYYDWSLDKYKGVQNICLLLGQSITRVVGIVTAALGVLLALCSLLFDLQAVYLVIPAAMGAVLTAVLYFTDYFRTKDRYGLVADLVFLLPGLLLLV